MSANKIIDGALEAMRREYALGVAAGFETTLRLLLGEPADGGIPCPQPITSETRAWAEAALAKIEAS